METKQSQAETNEEVRAGTIGKDLEMRRPLEDFAQEMKRVLRTHDDEKTGWEEMPPDKILNKIIEEYDELREAHVHYRCNPGLIISETGRQNLMHECIDLANACMMMWDNLEREHRDPEVPEKLKGDGDHEFKDIPPDEDDFDSECVLCGVRIKSCYGMAGAMMPCYEEQRASKRKTKVGPGNKGHIVI